MFVRVSLLRLGDPWQASFSWHLAGLTAGETQRQLGGCMAKSQIADRRRRTRVEESHGGELPRIRSRARIAYPLDVAALVLVTVAAFAPVLRNGFVNWDDPAVLLNNARLAAPDVLAWAFTTTLIGHYQPLAWLAWSAVKSTLGLTAAAFHGLSLLGHVANAVLVYVVALRLVDA